MRKDVKEFLEYMVVAGVAFAVVMHLHNTLTGKSSNSNEQKVNTEQVDSVKTIQQRAMLKKNIKTR